MGALFEACWLVHVWLLEIVRPRVILCLGNDEGLSPYALLRRSSSVQVLSSENRAYRTGKYFRARIQLEQGYFDITAFGVPHPSRFEPSVDGLEYLANVFRACVPGSLYA